MTYPSKSVRKRFDPTMYRIADKMAKDCMIKYLTGIGHDVLKLKENYGVDLQSTKWDGHSLHEFYHEVEMKFMWEGDWPKKWKDIHIPFRKNRLITKVYNIDEHANFFFYIIRGDCEKAWMMDGQIVKSSPVVEVPNRAVRKGEYFFKVPVKKAKLLDLGGQDGSKTD